VPRHRLRSRQLLTQERDRVENGLLVGACGLNADEAPAEHHVQQRARALDHDGLGVLADRPHDGRADPGKRPFGRRPVLAAQFGQRRVEQAELEQRRRRLLPVVEGVEDAKAAAEVGHPFDDTGGGSKPESRTRVTCRRTGRIV
jgi:hypothetical protein